MPLFFSFEDCEAEDFKRQINHNMDEGSERKDDMLGTTFVTTKLMGKPMIPLEKAIGEEYNHYLREQKADEQYRREYYMEEASRSFKQWFGDYPFYFEQGELVRASGGPEKILVIRSGEIRLYFQMLVGYHRFNLVRVCDNCGKTFLDPETWIKNLRSLAVEVKKEGKWYCPKCDA